ncbi:mucin-19 [Anopheles gambiae]|uniref:mucin-19 n=1 Tax=Anopheles gambiae TaxID=7165 RepID=UPI002AC92DC3|nr:mucin-19 [Anopheles gambiae]XP_061507307.1 mucin-19 [Anopheles gambiae]XP_061507372.1 mucin-19 [Anopheles gambiae]
MLCSPGASAGAADASTDAAWWSPGKGRMDVGRTSATTGERSPGDGPRTAAPGCRNEFDKATSASFSGAEASITVHDVCNKSGGSGSSNGGSGRPHDSSGGCGGQFSSGARSHVAPGSCSGGGTAAAATPAGAPAAVRQHQPTSIISPKKPCDYSSIISVRSSSSNSNRGGGGGGGCGRPYGPPSYGGGPGSTTPTTTTNTAALSTALSPPTPPPSLLLPDIDWTNETCLGGAGTDHDFTNTIVDGPAGHHLWLRSPTASSSSSNITDTELERSLDEYQHVRGMGPARTALETSIDCANLLDELQVELAQPALALSSPVSLHEEIEQLSSAFDCDASNHLVSTVTAEPVAAAAGALPFLGLAADDTEPISLNILKWLQEDISTGLLPEQQPPPQPSPAPDLFEHSLDQIHNITGLARLGNKAAAAASRRIGATNATTAAVTNTTTTTTTTTHSADPQRDHNYFAMKRRLQQEEEEEVEAQEEEEEQEEIRISKTSSSKMPRLASDEGRWATAGESTIFSAPPATNTICKQLHQQQQQQQQQQTTNAMGRKLASLASRKAATLAINVSHKTSEAAPAHSTINGQALAALLQTTTTTTTTTTPSTYEPSLRVPPLAAATTLNTPDLTNDILDLEDEKFDLLSFIDTNDESLEFNPYHATVEEKPTLELLASPAAITPTGRTRTILAPKQPPQKKEGGSDAERQICQLLTLDSLRQLTSAAEDVANRAAAGSTSASPTGGSNQHHGGSIGRRTNASSSACSIGSRSSASSVCGDSGSDVSSSTTNTTAKTPKRRGRPPKQAGTVRDRSQYQHLSEADWRYREQRDKNNEASRKSRINRKDRELKLELEADRLSAQHQKLSYEERRLQQDCQRWRKAVMKLALL